MGDFQGHPFRGNQYIQGGASLGRVFHGSSKRVETPDLSQAQSRDYGYYGSGFYTASQPEYTKGYGRVVTGYEVAPEATVLHAGMKPEKHPELIRDILEHATKNWRPAAEARGKGKEFDDEMAHVAVNGLSFKNAVDRFARDLKVDIVKYGEGEIVVKNPKVLSAIPKGGKWSKAREVGGRA